MKILVAVVIAGALVSGCSSQAIAPPSTSAERTAVVEAASRAVKAGRHDEAEMLLQDYLYRGKDGRLRLKLFGLAGDDRALAIDTVAALLWETGRDVSLAGFADTYLPRYERTVMHCRLAERQARYQDAYRCWNGLGHVDRAERVIRTGSAIDILGR